MTYDTEESISPPWNSQSARYVMQMFKWISNWGIGWWLSPDYELYISVYNPENQFEEDKTILRYGEQIQYALIKGRYGFRILTPRPLTDDEIGELSL